MKTTWTRRQAIKTLAVTTAAATSPVWPTVLLARRGQAPEDSLADQILETPRERILEMIEPWLTKGLTWEKLQGVLFRAGIREIEPRPVGNKLHSVLAIESVFQLGGRAAPRDRLMAALWNLDEIKVAQRRDVAQRNWTLPPRPQASYRSREAAERDLRAALEAFDNDGADRAIVGLLQHAPLDQVFEFLWPYGMREHVDLCHRALFAVHVKRTLARLEPDQVEPAMRSLVYGLMEAEPGPTVEEFLKSEEAIEDLHLIPEDGKTDVSEAIALAESLRRIDSDEAREQVLHLLDDEVSPATVWDGLRLAAADNFFAVPGLLSVHATTVTNALFFICRTTESERMRKLSLLQAVAWMPLFRDRFVDRFGHDMTHRSPWSLLNQASDKVAADLDQSFVQASPELLCASLEQGASIQEFERQLCARLFHGADENHQAKYAAAVLEDAHLVDERLRPALLAPTVAYLPTSAKPQTDLARRSAAVVERVRGGS